MSRKRVFDELNGFASRQIGKLQLRLLQIVTVENPVRTGFSRGGWTPSTGTADLKISKPPKDEEQARSEGAANFSKNLSRSQGISKTYRLQDGSVFISNNVPYIGRLNAGTSAQAPAMFVESAILTAVRLT